MIVAPGRYLYTQSAAHRSAVFCFERIQTALLARLVHVNKKIDHNSPPLLAVHWLPDEKRFLFVVVVVGSVQVQTKK